MRKVEVVFHNPIWQEMFEEESKYVANALGENVITIYHIGSTAIPHIYAKPIIDLLVEVKDILKVDEQSSAMEMLGYQVMGEFRISGRRFFRKDNQEGIRTHHIHVFAVGVEVKDILKVDEQSSAMEMLGYQVMGEFRISGRRFFRKDNQEGIRTHHIHVFAVGSAQIERHLVFRDYLIAYPEDAQKYSDLKRKLAIEYPTNIEGYMDGKHGFIQAIDQKAAQWQMNLLNDKKQDN